MALKKLYVLCFLNFFSIGLFVAIQSRHIISLGGTRVTHGVLGSLHSFLQLLLGPIIGTLSDTKGRKPLLYITLIGVILSDLLLGVKNLNAFILSRVLFGCFCHIQLLLKAFVTDWVKNEEQVAVFGKMGAIAGIAFIVGPVASGHIVAHEGGFDNLVILLTLLDLTSLGLTISLPQHKSPTNKPVKKRGGPFSKLREVNWNIFWDVFLLKLLTEVGFSLFFQTFGPYLTEIFNTSQKEIGYIIAYFSTCMIVSNLLLEKANQVFYSNDHTFRKRNFHGLIGLCSTFAVLYLFPSFWMFIGVMLPLSVCKTLLDRIWMKDVVQRSSDGDKGTVIGAFESLIPMSGLAAPITSAFISSYYGYDMVIACSILPLILAISVLVLKGNEDYYDDDKDE